MIPSMSDTEQSKNVMSYLIGFRLGNQMIPQMLPGLTAEDINLDKIAKGIAEGLSGNMDSSVALENIEEHQNTFMNILKSRADAAGGSNLESGRIFMEENAKKSAVITTESGLQYEILTQGEGDCYKPEVHGDAPTAKVMYKGTLIDGSVFDQSALPIEFGLKQVIPGFTEALSLMPIGSKWRVTIPAALAYGANGPGSIGPHSTLIFEMELLALSK